MATWFPVWTVAGDGSRLVEEEAARSANGYHITVRKRGTTSRAGWSRYQAHWFDKLYGETPEQAIEKYEAKWQNNLAVAEQEAHDAEQMLTHADTLRASLRPKLVTRAYSEPHTVGTDAPTPENDPVGRFSVSPRVLAGDQEGKPRGD